MTLSDFLSAVQAIVAADPRYKLGHAGDDGYCDCIGLIIGACERNGIERTGVHGSNWWARYYTESLMRVTDADDLSLGDIVYKAHSPGDTGYDLPDRYTSHPDKRDYYHVGVVTQVNPLQITHCTTGDGVDGIKVDTKLGKWTYKGQLTLIADGSDAPSLGVGYATVTAPSGSTVNLRDKPSKRGSVIERIPVGTTVEVESVDSGWAKVRVMIEGYMMTEYLYSGGESVG